MSYQTVSQFICHRLSFSNPAPFFVVWFNRTSSFVGTHMFIKRDDNVFVQIENCFRCGVPLDPSRLVQIFHLALLSLLGKGVNYGR